MEKGKGDDKENGSEPGLLLSDSGCYKEPFLEERKDGGNGIPKRKEIELITVSKDSGVPHVRKSLISELQHSKQTRFKLVKSFLVASAFMILGWTKGQLGPAFLDLLYITGTDLKSGSGFMTSYYAGRMSGSILAGFIYSKVNKYLIFVISITVHGIVVGVIPWCYQYELMVGAHLLQGISGGVLDVAITSEAVTIWGPTARGRSYLQLLAASFAISGLLAPFATAPFLLQPNTDNSRNLSVLNQSLVNSSMVTYEHEMTTTNLNFSNTSDYHHTFYANQQDSRLYIAYFISSGIACVVAIPFVVLFFKSGASHEKTKKQNSREFIGTLPMLLKYLQVINIGVFSSAITAMDFTFGGYLSAFCVQYLLWTKADAAMLTSVVFFATLVGRLGGIFIVHRFKSHTLNLSACITCIVGLISMYINARMKADIGIWLSVCLVGIPLGIIWPVFLSWVNENLIPIYGKVAAFLLVTSFGGAMISPVLVGYLMENFTLLWFCYFCIIKAGISSVCVLLMLIYTRILKNSENIGNNITKIF
ncbi:sodium-dependent glucose transporter 1A-like [Argopecten irradians]|uniref:sodium-dependent glucose transporter 1A-like n=1 Tax=Argopecten irradians TaxID=31199 RepID=UPI0037212AF7